jgi:hypothetical protein
MSDLQKARGPEREPQIDTVGWLFLVFAVAIQPPLRWLLTATRWLRMPLCRS